MPLIISKRLQELEEKPVLDKLWLEFLAGKGKSERDKALQWNFSLFNYSKLHVQLCSLLIYSLNNPHLQHREQRQEGILRNIPTPKDHNFEQAINCCCYRHSHLVFERLMGRATKLFINRVLKRRRAS